MVNWTYAVILIIIGFYYPEVLAKDLMKDAELAKRHFNLFSKPRASSEASMGGSSLDLTSATYALWDYVYEEDFKQITSAIKVSSMYASFMVGHKQATGHLRRIILDIFHRNNVEDSLSFLEYLRFHRTDLHPMLLVNAVTSAEASSSTFDDFPSPPLPELFPSRFFPSPSLEAMDEGCQVIDEDWTKGNGEENKLWYFREDVQLNLHHWLWHLNYPTDSFTTRRGELFYFFHHEMMARYTVERLANGFSDYKVEGLLPSDNLILELGYQVNLGDGVYSTKKWVNRPNNTVLNNSTLSNDSYQALLNQTLLYERLINLTETGKVQTGLGDVIVLPDGTNLLGELIEASAVSIGRWFYGNDGWHNDAHFVIGCVNVINCTGADNERFGVLMDTATAMRDPLFYRIHSSTDDLFSRYKRNMLQPYELTRGDHALVYPTVTVKSVSVTCNNCSEDDNVLSTFWNQRHMNLSGGFDFNSKNNASFPNVSVCLKHLDHHDFTYNIELTNDGEDNKDVFVRIFMAPRFKPDGERFTIEQQSPLFFTLDTFTKTLDPGSNSVIRSSLDSSVTSPWWTSMTDLEQEVNNLNHTMRECTCGFPHHLLLPKGTEVGMTFDLVVMVTNGDDFNKSGEILNHQCLSAYVHCGIPGYEYPDAKPMGYPWDRKPRDGIMNGNPTYLESFLAEIPNMEVTTISIRHSNSEQ